ncbi:MAG: hypothetical protein FRX48_04708 [Lasallia pustulata]|uniref:Uncharacterized protein n=1 Tax=Lasallia pustulata TaxID=136370 RepID=A0A5M8PPI3_9LECA|nr:MAG: hypothetical protein FRX48_04708 [Lasallia pustulata]
MSASPTRLRPRPHPATCEDWNDDARTTIPDTRRTANSAAKRSSKPDISLVAKVGEDNTSKLSKVGKDGASDSGYSSQTAATVGSGGSSQRSRLGLAPLTLDTGAASDKIKTPRPESKPKSATRKSPTKLQPIPTASKGQGKDSTRPEGCKCPDCAPKKQPAVTPVEPRPPQDYFTLHQTSRPRGAGPPSPQSARAPPPDHAQHIPSVNTAQPRTRPPSAQPHRMTRPMSFHAGMRPEIYYYPAPPVYVEQRPQPIFVAPPTLPIPPYPATSTTYTPSPVQSVPPNYPMPSPYEQTRTQTRQWPAESHTHPSRPPAMYEPPIVQYGGQQPSYTTGAPPQPHSHPAPRDSSYHRERHANPMQEYYERVDDYYRMPPPPAPNAPSEQRPTIRHAATTSTGPATLRRHRSGEDSPPLSSRKADVSFRHLSRHESVPEHAPRSRRQSLAARPSGGPPRASYTSAPNERILVERAHVSDKQRRRASYYGQDSLEQAAERYQYDTIHAAGNPIKTAPTIDSVKTSKTTQSQASVAGSHSSSTKSASGGGRSREGSDVKARSGVSSRAAAAGTTDGDEFLVRFPAGVKVDLKGEAVKGQTITFQQSGNADGSMELRIGGRKAGDEGTDRARAAGTKPNSHSEASHSGTLGPSDLGAPPRSESRMRRPSMYSDSGAPSRSGSRMRRGSNLEEVAEGLRVGGRSSSRRPSRGREFDGVAEFGEVKGGGISRRGSPVKEMESEDLTLTERRMVRVESRSGRSSRSGYSGK